MRLCVAPVDPLPLHQSCEPGLKGSIVIIAGGQPTRQMISQEGFFPEEAALKANLFSLQQPLREFQNVSCLMNTTIERDWEASNKP